MRFICRTASPREGRFERLEPDEGRLSCPVLRGRGGGNAALLPGPADALRALNSVVTYLFVVLVHAGRVAVTARG